MYLYIFKRRYLETRIIYQYHCYKLVNMNDNIIINTTYLYILLYWYT